MGSLDNYRKAAMHVYCLSEGDKQWILSRLKDSEKRVINEHINEMKSLSVPKDQYFIKAAIEALEEKSEKELYEILNRSVLIDIDSVLDVFEREPAWVGACLKLEYPGLVESYIVPKMSKLKLREIDLSMKQAADKFTKKFKSTVFDVASLRLRQMIPALDKEFKKIEFESALKKAV